MSRWTHSICVGCWNAREPGRQVDIAIDGPDDTCCFCGGPHSSGIYVRHDPETVQCGGVRGYHAGRGGDRS